MAIGEGKINYQEVVAATDFISNITNSMAERVKNNCNAVSERTALVGFSSQVAQTAIDNYLAMTATTVNQLVNDVAQLSDFIKQTIPAAYQNVEEEVMNMFAYEAEGIMAGGLEANWNNNGNYVSGN